MDYSSRNVNGKGNVVFRIDTPGLHINVFDEQEIENGKYKPTKLQNRMS